MFSGAGKFCLAHWLRQLTRDIKYDVRTLNFRRGVTFAPQRKNTEWHSGKVVLRRKMSEMKEMTDNK